MTLSLKDAQKICEIVEETNGFDHFDAMDLCAIFNNYFPSFHWAYDEESGKVSVI